MDLRILLVDRLLKPKTEYKNLNKSKIRDTFMKPRVAFNMKWLMEILKIYMDEQLLTK